MGSPTMFAPPRLIDTESQYQQQNEKTPPYLMGVTLCTLCTI
jgi:hypothetical protein